MARDYSSIYSVKNFAIKDLAPKYLDMNKVNDLNVGLLGYITELVSSVAEDGFNTTTTYMNEIFPHLAVLPESIYNHAGLFQLDGSFAVPSSSIIYLFVPEASIIQYATKVKSATNTEMYEFYLDSNMTIDVEGFTFKPDYDIQILYRRYNNDYIFTANYVQKSFGEIQMEGESLFKNSISNIDKPFIKTKRIFHDRTRYLQLEIQTHNVNRFIMESNVINSDIINLPTYDIEFDDKLANFEVFYREPNSTKYVQMQKRLLGTVPLKDPFCYYSKTDEQTLKLSFTTRDNYFKPEYNSEIRIVYDTTMGASGNFDTYVGTEVHVITNSDVYDYNNRVTVFGIPFTGASGGIDPLTLEQLKYQTVGYYSTAGSYSTSNDLQVYFDNISNQLDSYIKFIKKRDDIVDRLFSSFSIYRNKSDVIYSANTLDIQTQPDNYDYELTQSDMRIMYPGHLFKYAGLSTDILAISDIEINETNTTFKISFDSDIRPYVEVTLASNTNVEITFYGIEGVITSGKLLSMSASGHLYTAKVDIPKSLSLSDDIEEIKYFQLKAPDISFNDEIRVIENKGLVESIKSKYIKDIISQDKDPDKPIDKIINEYIGEDLEFVYSNPYLIYFSKDPALLGYYLNTVNDKYLLDIEKVNDLDSFTQFICNTMKVYRNAIAGENKYKLTLALTPSSLLMHDMVTEITDETISDDELYEKYGSKINIIYKEEKRFVISNRIQVKVSPLNTDGNAVGYIFMTLEDWDIVNDVYTFSCYLETDDYITADSNFKVTNLHNNNTGEIMESQLINMDNCNLRVETLYNESDEIISDNSKFIVTNTYNTKSTPVAFIKPITMIKSDAFYDETVTGDYNIIIKSSPLLKASILTSEEDIMEFIEKLNNQYSYLLNITDKITNNFSIDMKVYNTYGKSKNFYIDKLGDDGISETLLDKVNITIKFKVHPVYGTIEEDLIRDVKIFIKEYIEGINIEGSNTIHISNLIKELENNFSSISFLRFSGINNYGPMVQSIENRTTDLEVLTKEERTVYVPEYLTVNLDDIIIEII